jgi:LacI family transcriptional regulator
VATNNKNATIIDVANEAGVSYATVSRVINNGDHVKPEKRERVLKAMAKLAFHINPQARSLRGGRSHMVGLVVHGMGTGYMGEIVRGIDEALYEAEYDLILYTTHRRKTKEAAYVSTLTRGMADGLLLVLPRNPEAYIESLRQRRFPYVLVDHQGIDITGPAVGATNVQGAYDATKHLIDLGHHRIGFITGTFDMGCAVDRLSGYKNALADHNISFDQELVQEGDFFQPRGYDCARLLLSLPNPPTAIFASNDVSALGVMEAVRDLGLRIPEDISIVGFDDIPQASQVNPPLTTVRQPLEQMGHKAAQMLLEYIADPEMPTQRIELPTELIVRASTRQLKDRAS